MPSYKEQLLAGITECGWEQTRVDPVGEGWWAAEHWFLRSVREYYGLEVALSFLVDPQFEGPGSRASAVWAIIATAELPTDRPLENGIALLSLQRGRFDVNLQSFLAQLDAWRHGQRPLAGRQDAEL